MTAPLRKRRLLALLFVVGLFVGMGAGLWYFAKDRLGNRPGYRLDVTKIVVPSPPEWVPDDFVERVLHGSGLDVDGSLLVPDIAQRLSQAFTADPWVESVQRVETRFPSGAEVSLTYRIPVALVELPSKGLFPVDGSGVLLPTDYFIHVDPQRKSDFPRIVGIQSMPLGSVGTLWGDPLVHEAAPLARALDDVVAEFELVKIRPVREATGVRMLWHLETAAGTDILWGRFEGDALKIDVKKKRLRELAEQYRSLDNVPSNLRPIDLTTE